MGRPTPGQFIPPPLPPSYAPTPTPSWHPPQPPPPFEEPVETLIAVLLVALFATPFFILAWGAREDEDRAEAAAAAAAAPLPPRALPQLQYFEELLHRLRQARFANPAAARRLPAFRYNRSVKHHVTAGAEEEEPAACSVCLGAFQLGETVRLLPVCLHLYHAECIDPWLDAHATCPICRSDTVPTTIDSPV